MGLPNVEWRFVGSLSPNVSSIAIPEILDNIYSLATSSSYNNGEIRVQGSSTTGTWSRYQNNGVTEAVYVILPSGQAVIISGTTGTPDPLPVMASPDTWSNGTLMVSMVKNPGVYLAWNDPNPFTSGSNFNYWRFFGTRTNSPATTFPSTNLYLYESKESIALFLITTSSTTAASYSNGFLAGALWDSESQNPLDSEEDGRLYGIISSGHYDSVGAAQSGTYIWGINQFSDDIQRDSATASIGFIVGHSTDNQGPHSGLFLPGSNTVSPSTLLMYPLEPIGSPTSAQISTNSLTVRSGALVRIPLVYRFGATTASSTAFNNVVGRLRNVSFCKRGTIGSSHMNGQETIGYVVSCSEVETADAILLEH